MVSQIQVTLYSLARVLSLDSSQPVDRLGKIKSRLLMLFSTKRSDNPISCKIKCNPIKTSVLDTIEQKYNKIGQDKRL